MGKAEKFLEGIKFPCFIESAKFYIDKDNDRKVRVDVVLTVTEKVSAFIPGNMWTTASSMADNKVEKVVFAEEFEERFVELFADEQAVAPAITAEDVTVKKVRLECDVEANLVTLHFSFVGDDKKIGTWIHDNYGRDAFINVLAMQGELAGL